MIRMPIIAAGLAVLAAGTALADDPAPYGGLRGEALEAAREGADGDRYVDPDKDPSNIAEREDANDTEVIPPAVPQYKNRMLGDGEIIIEDGEVTEGLLEED